VCGGGLHSHLGRPNGGPVLSQRDSVRLVYLLIPQMVGLLKRCRTRRAKKKARRQFELWKHDHPVEARILELLATESRYEVNSENPRRGLLLASAREQRRALGLTDDLVPHIYDLPSGEGGGKRTPHEVVSSPEELALLGEVNHGFWLSAGFFLPGIRKLSRRK